MSYNFYVGTIDFLNKGLYAANSGPGILIHFALMISRVPLKLDIGNELLLNRKSYIWSILVIVSCLKNLWNVGYVVFTLPYMVIISKPRLQLMLE